MATIKMTLRKLLDNRNEGANSAVTNIVKEAEMRHYKSVAMTHKIQEYLNDKSEIGNHNILVMKFIIYNLKVKYATTEWDVIQITSETGTTLLVKIRRYDTNKTIKMNWNTIKSTIVVFQNNGGMEIKHMCHCADIISSTELSLGELPDDLQYNIGTTIQQVSYDTNDFVTVMILRYVEIKRNKRQRYYNNKLNKLVMITNAIMTAIVIVAARELIKNFTIMKLINVLMLAIMNIYETIRCVQIIAENERKERNC